eukprot:CAMPEP_0197175064 /NCGR_PEP_ID=MMETSP1423-20130617/1386_1 /TAXON_ID=476441 /ORGANISM="Pseudo-nitzschia heimii, Strain UNC1101" /LENGTH=595 /DNA_ID=CAMNT_0042624125 /DNA_START=60 /DNA_END=1847 /DNA_ORIENTATION=-
MMVSSSSLRMLIAFFTIAALSTTIAVASSSSSSTSSSRQTREEEEEEEEDDKKVVYGTQCSFAITGPILDGCGDHNDDDDDDVVEVLLDDRQRFYDEYMEGCYRKYSKGDCDEEELDRHVSNRDQPRSMVNMTSTGYTKRRAPPELMKLLTSFWEVNSSRKKREEWGEASVFANHWSSPTYMVSVEDESLEGGGDDLKKAVWDAAVDGIAEWTGGIAKIRPVSLYGIREYTEGAVLSPHVDRVPLVSSGIVNVAQDVDEPWPLEVYDRNGLAVNVTMEPGDMILYESHSLIHGRPFPLKGRYFANVFIHFEPYDGWDDASARGGRGDEKTTTKLGSNTGDLPPYIIPGSPEEERYRESNPNGWFKDYAEGDEPPVGEWARENRLRKLRKVAEEVDRRLLRFEDENGWTPLHEAAGAGHLEVVRYLVENGASVDVRTNEDETALRIAINELGEDHPVVRYLRDDLGAEDHGDVDVEEDEEEEPEEDGFDDDHHDYYDENHRDDDDQIDHHDDDYDHQYGDDDRNDHHHREEEETDESTTTTTTTTSSVVPTTSSMMERLETELEREVSEIERRILEVEEVAPAIVVVVVRDDDEDL